MSGPAVSEAGAAKLHVMSVDGVLLVEIHGVLDATAARVIDAVTKCAVIGDLSRVRIDFGSVDGYTREGVDTFAALQARFVRGEHRGIAYCASSERGQEALLAACGRTS